MAAQRYTWDIFCAVVDNYGDIGVCWRLAQQLVAEHGLVVRLWVDDLAPFHKICPEIDLTATAQSCRGVEVRHWRKPFPPVTPGEIPDVVVEAFACHLPEAYENAMAAREPKPVWINLEYLSAEAWVTGCHGLPSPHPRLPLTKHFFFPGFVPGTGGLLAEAGLAQRRDAFQQDPRALSVFWQSIGLVAPADHELTVSLFSYHNLAVAELLEAWAKGEGAVRCLVPEGKVLKEVAGFFGRPEVRAGDVLRQGSLEICVLPFLQQDRYDQLLWACKLNFVRGEDSLVRAQWAARPLVWYIYPQDEGAHWAKLAAFLDLYCADLAPVTAMGLRTFWQSWNRQEAVGQAWPGFWQHQAELETHARRWAGQLASIGLLAKNLVHYCQQKL